MGNERLSFRPWLDARERVYRGRRPAHSTETAGGNRNWQAGIVRIFGKGRHRPSASWRQATDRAFRIGQTRNVQVRKFICVGTMEERVDEMIERKKALAESIVGTGEEWLTELSVAELRDVLRLSPEAVSD